MRESKIRLIQYILGIVIAVAVFFHLQIFSSILGGVGYIKGLLVNAVASRMDNAFYDGLYIVLLFAVLSHGLIGLRNILFELTIDSRKRIIINIILIIVFIVAFCYGLYPIVLSKPLW